MSSSESSSVFFSNCMLCFGLIAFQLSTQFADFVFTPLFLSNPISKIYASIFELFRPRMLYKKTIQLVQPSKTKKRKANENRRYKALIKTTERAFYANSSLHWLRVEWTIRQNTYTHLILPVCHIYLPFNLPIRSTGVL